MLHLILLSGGSGTRLWPLSNSSRSKQFLKVLRDDAGESQSMVQRTFEQLACAGLDASITVATCESQVTAIERQTADHECDMVVEPERRDTAPAIMLACAHLAFDEKIDPDDTVAVLPIDTYAAPGYYRTIADVDAAVQADAADIVLLGVKPTYPSAKYGYIVPRGAKRPPYPVERFVEKPAEAAAADLIADGALWNCGVFGFKLSYLVDVLSRYSQAETFADLRATYADLPKNSFDYEVVEKADSIAVVPYAGEWKDLGTWNTLSEEMADDCAGRVVLDRRTCDNVHVINETGLPMVVAGLSDSVIIATPDGILVSGKAESADIKGLVAESAESRPMYEHRRWGKYRVVDSSVFGDGSKALTKELRIEPGAQMSYQRHMRRSEVWTVVSGRGEVVLDGETTEVGIGSVVQIERGRMHSARAFEELDIIEVQLGDILVEEDIERFGNYWN